ncbi:uncharacterized protein LOC118154737 [Callithrix jacchus]|uniref:uncharacterized protein LOC118154737 n=1 Tax=Callithrix jacchus TaxID=9483 RepID=UPI00159D14CE|nr:uncharacterized protein LOC118154737 [Callithrix jacchus]
MRSPASARPEPGSSGRERGAGSGREAGGGGGRERHSHSRRALATSCSRGRPGLEGRGTNQRARGKRSPPRGALIGPTRATQLREIGLSAKSVNSGQLEPTAPRRLGTRARRSRPQGERSWRDLGPAGEACSQ